MTEEKPVFLQAVSDTRAMLEGAAELVKKLQGVPGGLEGVAADPGEVIANIMLAYRHLEDAKMCLGKVIQAYQGGRSVYDEAPRSN